MLRALTLAFGQLFTGPILAVLGGCVLLSIGCFVALWFGIDWMLGWLVGDTGEWSTTLGWLGGALTAVLAYLSFPLVTSAFVGLFLERVATLVERRHYPHLPAADGLGVAESIVVTVRFVAVLIGVNVLLVLLLVIVPFAYPVAWLLCNGWLLGREYFELVALRRLDREHSDELRRRRGTECLLTGMALAFLLTVPFVNLVMPVFATAVMVHRFHDWQRVLPGRKPAPPSLPHP